MTFENKLEYRMYGLVLYSLSPMQKSIQHGHAVVEYALKYFNDTIFQEWANNHKTFIILDGGTSSMMLENLRVLYEDLKYNHAPFYEPDCFNGLTAISLILDETIYDDKKYSVGDMMEYFLQTPDEQLIRAINTKEEFKTYDLIGKEGLRLRKFIKQFNLAR